MKQELLSKQFASSSIEELLANSSGNEDRHSWLLSYLDVFVLIVMLVITLMAIGDYTQPPKTEQRSKKTLSAADLPKPLRKNEATDLTTETSTDNIFETNKQLKNVNPEPSNDKKGINHISDFTKPDTIEKPDLPPQSTTSANDSPAVLPMSPINTSQTTRALPALIENTPTKHSEIEIELTENSESVKTQDNLQDYWQQQLNKKLDSLDLNDLVSINVQQGYAQIEIQENILFESADADLTYSGALVLQRLISILRQSAGLIYIEGHTDNQPISTARYPSNWELGSARATSVLHFLASQNLNQNRLRAVTYADTMPIADNNTETGRRKNRRVNILIKMPDNKVNG